MSDLLSFNALAPEPTTEIFLIDANLARIASGIGELKTKIAPGVYKLRYKSGTATFDQLVDFQPTTIQPIPAPKPLCFETAVPLEDTKDCDNLQVQLLKHLIETTQAPASANASGFLIFQREQLPGKSLARSDITLTHLGGEVVSTITTGVRDDNARVRYVRGYLEPGTYGLRLDVGLKAPVEIFVTLCPGWETQIFLNQTYLSNSDSERFPTLQDAAIAMKRYDGPSGLNLEWRCGEMLRIAHEQGRSIASANFVDTWLGLAAPDPVSGLYLAHALLQTEGARSQKALAIVTKLAAPSLLGIFHPDVAAMLLHITKDAHKLPEKATTIDLVGSVFQTITHIMMTVTNPPTLRASWEYLVALSKRRATVIPPSSFNAQLAGNLIAGTMYLTRETSERPAFIRERTVSLAAAKRLQETVRSNADLAQTALSSPHLNLNNLERNVLQSIIVDGRLESSLLDGRSPLKEGNNSLVTQLVNASKAPSYSVANAIANVATLFTHLKN